MEFDRTGVAGRAATADDAVGGVLPRWVALPESTEEISAVLRACAERDLAVVPVGGGTKLHWGAPPERCDVLLDLCCMNDVVEHAAGDLVVRAQAGLAMSALAEHLAEAGQELALDPPMAAEGATVGGTLATAVAGPRAFRYGTARDLLIGITVVLADGTIAKAGGKVVKNVAGYDLGKLFTGSYGTLGVIAEATFRLHPLPADRRWIVARSPRAEVGALALALAASQAEPSAVEIDAEGAEAEVAVLVEGSAAGQRAEALNLVIKGAISTAPRPGGGRRGRRHAAGGALPAHRGGRGAGQRAAAARFCRRRPVLVAGRGRRGPPAQGTGGAGQRAGRAVRDRPVGRGRRAAADAAGQGAVRSRAPDVPRPVRGRRLRWTRN